MTKSLKALSWGMALLAVGTIGWFSRPVAVHAEEDGGVHDVITDMRGTNSYHWWWYPGTRTYFDLPIKYESRFDIHNGMFAEVYYREFYPHGEFDQLREKSGDLWDVHLKVNMSFYTPTGEFLGEYKEIQPNVMYNIPQNRHSRSFDRLQVKLENYSRATRECRFLVVDSGPGNIQGAPIPGVWREP